MSRTSNTLILHDDPQITLSPPILTKVSTRGGMVLIKLDQIAVTHLRTAGLPHPFHRSYYHWATTGPLDLQPLELPPLIATVKIYWNGCSKQETNKFVSIFVAIRDPDHKPLSTPLIVRLFYKNFKNKNGQSLHRSFKLTPSGNSIEGGIKDFLPLTIFNATLAKDNIVSFGILIKRFSPPAP